MPSPLRATGTERSVRVLHLEAGDVENDPFMEKVRTATEDNSNYEQIIRYLRLMRPLYQRLDALDEWQAIVDDLRHRYPGRKVLMEMLKAL